MSKKNHRVSEELIETPLDQEDFLAQLEASDDRPLIQFNKDKLRGYWKKSSKYVIGGLAAVAAVIIYGAVTSGRRPEYELIVSPGHDFTLVDEIEDDESESEDQ